MDVYELLTSDGVVRLDGLSEAEALDLCYRMAAIAMRAAEVYGYARSLALGRPPQRCAKDQRRCRARVRRVLGVRAKETSVSGKEGSE